MVLLLKWFGFYWDGCNQVIQVCLWTNRWSLKGIATSHHQTRCTLEITWMWNFHVDEYFSWLYIATIRGLMVFSCLLFQPLSLLIALLNALTILSVSTQPSSQPFLPLARFNFRNRNGNGLLISSDGVTDWWSNFTLLCVENALYQNMFSILY